MIDPLTHLEPLTRRRDYLGRHARDVQVYRWETGRRLALGNGLDPDWPAGVRSAGVAGNFCRATTSAEHRHVSEREPRRRLEQPKRRNGVPTRSDVELLTLAQSPRKIRKIDFWLP